MLVIITIIAAIITVLLASLFKNVEWDQKLKLTLATVISVIDGSLATIVAHGGISGFGVLDMVDMISLVFTSSQLIYGFLLKGDTAPLSKVEEKLANTLVKPKE